MCSQPSGGERAGGDHRPADEDLTGLPLDPELHAFERATGGAAAPSASASAAERVAICEAVSVMP